MEKMIRETMGLMMPKADTLTQVSLENLIPRPQPRKHFDDHKLQDLAESVKAHGVLEPLLVRSAGEDKYEILAGERRYRAAQMAGLAEVPVVVLEVDDKEARAIALVENLQREDLNPYEETVGILDLLALELGKEREEVVSLLHRMRDEARRKVPHNVMGSREGQAVEALFKKLGRMTWESFVQNRLPLLNLPEDLREALEEGSIPYTAALELKKVKDEGERRRLLEEVKAGLSFRELKKRVREPTRKPEPPRAWHREVATRLARLDLEALPPERRARVEEKLRELLEALEEG
ncbi:ParB/RepB/Spo0J family partition protein [Thermus filiformis]|uniref:Chromosome partitioning protein ParB n=1 Tax=Thermus filiformis TaxID=276 RepID=A0A0A2XB00_THEFI|nr:ParB/RepB/Spo0J family partition protein [Thermus filiformis]KGQ22364.2 chromosome partitioning protein ParB [Thermus filiformis]